MQERTKKRYSPEESVIVIERLLDAENDGWAFRSRTAEHVLFRCPGCGQESYRVYLDSGRASCSNLECEQIPTKSEALFSAVARLCGYDKQEHKEEVWGRIGRELEAHEKEERERELEVRRQLEERVESLEGQLAAERKKVFDAAEEARVLGDWNRGLREDVKELRRALEARAGAEAKNASMIVALVACLSVLFWLALFQRVAGVEPSILVDLFLSGVVAGLLTAVFYQGAVRDVREDRTWVPFYRRIDPDLLFSWTWKFLATFVVPLVLLDWLLGTERVYSALPVGTFGWEALVSAMAVGLAVHFFWWVSPAKVRG
jgi:hypothetical protein